MGKALGFILKWVREYWGQIIGALTWGGTGAFLDTNMDENKALKT